MQTNYGALLHSSMLPTDNTTQYHGGCPIKGVQGSPYTVVPNYIHIFIFRAGCQVNAKSSSGGKSALALAAFVGHMDIFEMLINHK